MTRPIAFLFPGQGVQNSAEISQLLVPTNPLVKKANDILGYDLHDLSKDFSAINFTQYTQPLVFVLNALCLSQTDKSADIFLGHSLGEYSALYAAGVFSFETGLQLVKKRGELMAEIKGGLVAVIGLELNELESLLQREFPEIDIANINTQDQIVISGLREDLEKAIERCEENGAFCIPLNVSGPFHSHHMSPLQGAFRDFLSSFEFSPPSGMVLSNVTAKPYEMSSIKSLLVDQLAKPVRWLESIEFVLTQGEVDFEEIGPGGVLTKLLRKIREKREVALSGR